MRKSREPEIIEIRKKMAQAEKKISPELLEKYRKLKSQGVYPPFVSLSGENQCGGCRVDMPMSLVSKLSDKGLHRMRKLPQNYLQIGVTAA